MGISTSVGRSPRSISMPFTSWCRGTLGGCSGHRGTEGQRSELGRGEWSIEMLQTLPLHIPAAGKLLGKRELGKVSGPKTREASGRITSLTAGLADAIGRRDPEVGGAGVEDHGEPLGRRPHAHDPVVLCLWGNSLLSPGQPPAAAPQEETSLGASHNCSLRGFSAIPFKCTCTPHKKFWFHEWLQATGFTPAEWTRVWHFKNLLSKHSFGFPMESTNPLALASEVARLSSRRNSHMTTQTFRLLLTDVNKKSVMQSQHDLPLPASESSDQWHKHCLMWLPFFLCN